MNMFVVLTVCKMKMDMFVVLTVSKRKMDMFVVQHFWAKICSYEYVSDVNFINNIGFNSYSSTGAKCV